VITRRNLTQGKQLTKHAQKFITAFMKRMSMSMHVLATNQDVNR